MEDEAGTRLQPVSLRRRHLLRLVTYIIAYLTGIVSCIAFTPVEFVLASRLLLDVYPWFSLLGFIFFFLGYETGMAQFWYVGLAGLGIMTLGIATFFQKWPRLAALRPWLLAFPVGFVGAMGAYYTIAGSI